MAKQKKKLTLEDLIALKEKPLTTTAEVYVPALGGTITIQRGSLMDYQRAIDAINSASSTEERVRATFEAIYTFCPILHDPNLHIVYGTDQEGCVPPDIVPRVFREDAGSISAVFNGILELYGDGVRTEVKN